MKIISANILATHRVEKCIHAWMNAHEHNLEEDSNGYVKKKGTATEVKMEMAVQFS